jgi:small subunit ribosomal protein S1
MKILRADTYGFCYGVKRAVKIAQEAPKGYNKSVATLGELVHNPRVKINLAKQSVGCADSLADFKTGDVVVFRSHGVGPAVYEEAKTKGLTVIDATCPHVKKAQLTAEGFAKEGRFVIIIGEKRHPEVKSILAWAGNNAMVVETEDDIQAVPAKPSYGVVCQTTFATGRFEEILKALQTARPGDYKVTVTICTATKERQNAAIALAKKVDVVFVFGGRNSANTRHLWELVSAINPRSYLLEEASGITLNMLKNASTIGITAGASTPEEIIEEAVFTMETMESLLGEKESMKLHIGMIAEGTVVAITNEEVVVDFGYQSEGSVAFDQWAAGGTKETVAPTVKVGDKVTLKVIASENQDGLVVMSKIKAQADEAWIKLPEQIAENKVLKVKGLRAVKGGLTVAYEGVNGFIPASHLDLKRVENIKEYEGKEMEAEVLECLPEKKRLVLSRRNLLRQEANAKHQAYEEEKAKRKAAREAAEAEAFATLKVGSTIHGTVKSVVDFGLFVEVMPYVQGLVHVSELSWEKGVKPSDKYKVGDEVDVYVKDLDPENRRISLSIKALLEDPWQAKAREIKESDILTGTVTRFLSFGAIVKLPNGLEGMVHISEIADKRIEKPEDVLKSGDEIKVKVLRIDTDGKKIALSIKKAKEDAEKAEASQYMEEKPALSQDLGEKLTESQKQ